MIKKPKILLSTSKNSPAYADAVEAAGGSPDARYLPECALPDHRDYDALILCGGSDVHPSLYGEEINGSCNIDRPRDRREIEVARPFIESGRPIFGICRGHQLLNVLLGGTLHQDIETASHHSADGGDATHRARACKDSVLARLYGDLFSINSAHHQAIARPAPHTRITLLAEEDGVIEAFEHESLPILGVQFHPERMALGRSRADTVDGLPLFSYFVGLC